MRSQALSAALFALFLSMPTIAAAQSDGPAPKAKSPRACFRAEDVDGFNAVDRETVDVSVGVRDVYRLTLFAPSPDIDWTQRIGVEARGSSWICSGADATIIVPGAIGVQRYPVTAIRKLSPEEIKARKAR